MWNLNRLVWSKNAGDADKHAAAAPIRPNIPDEELVKASQRGDARAFEQLILRYQRQIFHLIFQMTRNVEVVEEMVSMIETQRTFEAYQKVMSSANDLDTKAIRVGTDRG